MNILNQKTASAEGVYIYANGDVEFMDRCVNPNNRQVGDVWHYFGRGNEAYLTYLTRDGDYSWKDISIKELNSEIQAFFSLLS